MRNRILEIVTVPASQLKANPNNFRVHPDFQKKFLSELFDEVGFVVPVIVYKDNDGNFVIVDGHLRTGIAESEPVTVVVTDLNELEANKMLLVTDKISSLASFDLQKEYDIIQSIDFSGDLASGFFEQRNEQLLEVLGLNDDNQDDELEQDEDNETDSGKHGKIKQKRFLLRLVLSVDDLSIIDSALKRTGIKNKGNALVRILKDYNESIIDI